MSKQTLRRRFLIESGRAALGLSVFSQAACSTSPPPTAGPDQSPLPATLIADLEKQVPALMESACVPGMAIALLANGRPAWSRSFGVTNATSKAPVTGDTLFNAASISKIVTRLTGRDIDAYIRSNIFDPFGMTSSGYVWNDAYADRYAAPHDGKGNLVPQSHPAATEAARYGSAGGLFTTATEYAQFLAEVVNPQPADAFRLTSGSRDEMIRPQVRVDDSSSWALGWRIVHGKGGEVILSNGDKGIEIIGKLTNGAPPLNALVSGA